MRSNKFKSIQYSTKETVREDKNLDRKERKRIKTQIKKIDGEEIVFIKKKYRCKHKSKFIGKFYMITWKK